MIDVTRLAKIPAIVNERIQRFAGSSQPTLQFIDVGMPALPIYDIQSREQESLLLTFTGPTAIAGSPNVLFNDDDLLERINDAKAFSIDDWSCIVTADTGPWVAQVQPEVQLRTPNDTVVRMAGWMTATVNSPDAVRYAVWGLRNYFDLEKAHWNQSQGEFENYSLENINFRVQNHSGGATDGTLSNVVIAMTLYY